MRSTYRNNQEWRKGNVVRVGFLTLRVENVSYHPLIYGLTSLDGNKRYLFKPYNGLEQVEESAT